MAYLPGTHLIATLKTDNTDSIHDYQYFRKVIDPIIERHDLQKLGEVFHNFQPGGFTSVICLSESHISVHTWPEYGLINLDIYLSNFKRKNDGTVRYIFEDLLHLFNATIISEQSITR